MKFIFSIFRLIDILVKIICYLFGHFNIGAKTRRRDEEESKLHKSKNPTWQLLQSWCREFVLTFSAKLSDSALRTHRKSETLDARMAMALRQRTGLTINVGNPCRRFLSCLSLRILAASPLSKRAQIA